MEVIILKILETTLFVMTQSRYKGTKSTAEKNAFFRLYFSCQNFQKAIAILISSLL